MYENARTLRKEGKKAHARHIHTTFDVVPTTRIIRKRVRVLRTISNIHTHTHNSFDVRLVMFISMLVFSLIRLLGIRDICLYQSGPKRHVLSLFNYLLINRRVLFSH